MALCAEMLILGGLSATESEARAKLQAGLDSGEAAERFSRMVAALGGPADLVDRPDAYLETAPIIVPVPSLQAGFATATDCRSLGLAVVSLGGGRRRPEDPIDFAVGQPLAMVHARTHAAAEQAVREVQAAYQVGAVKAAANPVTYRTIRP
jgi:thymidine phosphorylase